MRLRTVAWSKKPELTPWRLFDDLGLTRTATDQMAADRAMLAEVAAGAPAALRLYTWRPAALSLGRFQPWEDVDVDACRQFGVEVVRRPTGGRALLHGADLTYAVALRRPPGRAGTVRAVYELLAAALIDGLGRLGVAAAVAHHDESDGRAGSVPERKAGPVCFASQQGADLRVGHRKLCGSAQTRARGAVAGERFGVVLQHGSILLDRLPIDETDLLRPPAGSLHPPRAELRGVTVTMAELGAPTDPDPVATALVAGFRETLDVDFTPRQQVEVGPAPSSTSGRRRGLGARPVPAVEG